MLCALATELDEMQQQPVTHRGGGGGTAWANSKFLPQLRSFAVAVGNDGHEDDGILNCCQALADHHEKLNS